MSGLVETKWTLPEKRCVTSLECEIEIISSSRLSTASCVFCESSVCHLGLSCLMYFRRDCFLFSGSAPDTYSG